MLNRDDLREALTFDTGANDWRTFDQWPPRQAVKRKVNERALGLTQHHALVIDQPSLVDGAVAPGGTEAGRGGL